MSQLVFSSCAKINLGLRILRKRPDGYHDIASIFVAIDLCDEIVIAPSASLTVECSPPVTSNIEDNLVHRAAVLLSDSLTDLTHKGAKITVKKKIPSGAGLGGGSSNAATTLMGLYELWTGNSARTSAARKFLAPLAEQLGSDVPFFLQGGVALVTGRGEQVLALDHELPWTFLLVLPEIHVDTALAYSTLELAGTKTAPDFDMLLAQSVENQEVSPDLTVNDFEPSVFSQHPLLSTTSDTLRNNGAMATFMSGSGSTIVGIYADVDKAEQARSAFPLTSTYICRPLPSLSPNAE